jgi:SH3 domain-containing protein
MMLRFVLVASCVSATGAAMAGPVRMSGDDIKRAMPGALLEIDTPLRISIPVKVSHDGLVSAEAGALGLTLGATKDRGRWWTEGDQLCMKWFRWFDAKRRCMTLQREGNKVYWSEGSGESGTATITEAVTVAAASPAAPAPIQPEAVLAEVPHPERETPPPAVADPAPPVVVAAPHAVAVSPPPPTPRDDDRSTRFATAALAETPVTVKPPKPHPTPKPAIAATDEPAPQQAKSHRAPPAPSAKHRAVAVAAATRVAKEPYRREQLFRVAGVEFGDQLNVRNGPSEYHPAVGTIPADARKVKITGTCRDLWCPVRHGNIEGWVNRFYLAEEVAPQKAASNQR